MDARTPIRFKQRVIEQFLSVQNYEFLYKTLLSLSFSNKKYVLSTLRQAMYDFKAIEIMDSDNRNLRGISMSAIDELKRLNAAFIQNRLVSSKFSEHDSYQMEMFNNDSMSLIKNDKPLFEFDDKEENGRFMRYPEIPFWQNCSRRNGYDRNIDETLGSATLEMDTHVRMWPTKRLTNPTYQKGIRDR